MAQKVAHILYFIKQMRGRVRLPHAQRRVQSTSSKAQCQGTSSRNQKAHPERLLLLVVRERQVDQGNQRSGKSGARRPTREKRARGVWATRAVGAATRKRLRGARARREQCVSAGCAESAPDARAERTAVRRAREESARNSRAARLAARSARCPCETRARDARAIRAAAGRAAPTRDMRPGHVRLNTGAVAGADARGQRDRQRGPREAGVWSAPEKRTTSKFQLTGL